MSGRIIRRILVDHARASRRGKRGGGAVRLPLNENIDAAEQRRLEIVALDDALTDLERLDAQLGRIVELRFFTGLSVEETAGAPGISAATVNRKWATARAWLLREMSRGSELRNISSS